MGGRDQVALKNQRFNLLELSIVFFLVVYAVYGLCSADSSLISLEGCLLYHIVALGYETM